MITIYVSHLKKEGCCKHTTKIFTNAKTFRRPFTIRKKYLYTKKYPKKNIAQSC